MTIRQRFDTYRERGIRPWLAWLAAVLGLRTMLLITGAPFLLIALIYGAGAGACEHVADTLHTLHRLWRETR